MNKDERERYARHILLKEVGGQGQKALMAARVLIVGAGGLGAPILQYLTAAGVGTIGVADDDTVELSNLQRQTIFRTEDIGRLKTEAARDFANRLNPHVSIEALPRRLDDGNAAEILAGYDLVIEGVDSFEARYALNRAAIALEKPLLSAAVGRFDGQLALFKPYENPGVLPCYRCLVPHAPPRDAQVGCAEEGVLGAVTGVVGALAAMEAVKALLSLGEPLAGRLLAYDGLAGRMRSIALHADPACPDCRNLKHAGESATA